MTTEPELWAKATELSGTGDRALLSYLLDNEATACLAKVLKATTAKDKLRRAAMTRERLLEEYVTKDTCSCETPGRCHYLMKQILGNNGLDGEFQKQVLGAMRTGRAKMRNICLIGPAGCGKSFLYKGLRALF